MSGYFEDKFRQLAGKVRRCSANAESDEGIACRQLNH
jgi:hypothetical protein